MYYHAQTFSVTVTGSVIRAVTCEKCGAAYHYQLSRTASGSASAPYGLGPEKARQRADKAARKHLARRLEREVELVPCPSCRWVSRPLLMTYRKSIGRGWMLLTVITILLSLLAAGILAINADDWLGHSLHWNDKPIGIIVLIAGCLLTVSICAQRYQRLRVNPNVLRKGLPNVPPGTPPALVETIDAEGRRAWTPVASDLSNIEDDGAWATFRPGKLVFEPMCCECLEPASGVLKIPFMKQIGAPCCDVCSRKLRGMFFRPVGAVAVVLAAAITAIGLSLDRRNEDYLAMMIGCGAVFAFVAIGAAAIFGHRGCPYRVRTVDSRRGIRKIWFRNPAYTAMLVRRLGEADGLFPQA